MTAEEDVATLHSRVSSAITRLRSSKRVQQMDKDQLMKFMELSFTMHAVGGDPRYALAMPAARAVESIDMDTFLAIMTDQEQAPDASGAASPGGWAAKAGGPHPVPLPRPRHPQRT